MMVLYDEQEVMRSYVESERHDLRIEIAKEFLKNGKLSIEDIAKGTDLSIEEVENLNRN